MKGLIILRKRISDILKRSDTLSAKYVSNNLKTGFIGRNIHLYDETTSTNDLAKQNCDFADGSVFIAESQTNGKGSRGRSWVSPKGSGIWLSMLLKPDISPVEASQITLVAGLAVCSACGIGSMIKWPNDVVINGKKLCGILTEASAVNDKLNYVVCGIGINVNVESFDDEIKHRATSMLIESGHKHDRNKIIAKLLNEFEHYYTIFTKYGLDAIMEEYRKKCITIGREVTVIYENGTVTGKAVTVNNVGTLAVDTENGIINVTSGEVSVRGIYGYV